MQQEKHPESLRWEETDQTRANMLDPSSAM